MMNMKKMLKEWKTYINELDEAELPSEKSLSTQIRLTITEKMRKYLFGTVEVHNPSLAYTMELSNQLITRYPYLYWAIFGSKTERKKYSNIYRPDFGPIFVRDKINYFLSYLSTEEVNHLATDIDQVIRFIQNGQHPIDKVQIPVELTGHPHIKPSFGSLILDRQGVEDWGMGGSITTPNGKSYLLYTLAELKKALKPTKSGDKLSDLEVYELYFYADEYQPPEPEPAQTSPSRFSPHALGDYESFLKMKQAAMKSMNKK